MTFNYHFFLSLLPRRREKAFSFPTPIQESRSYLGTVGTRYREAAQEAFEPDSTDLSNFCLVNQALIDIHTFLVFLGLLLVLVFFALYDSHIENERKQN